MQDQHAVQQRYWIYHKKNCVDGKIVYEKEYRTLLSQGWVKTPNDFKKKDKPDETVVARETLDGAETNLVPEVITEG